MPCALSSQDVPGLTYAWVYNQGVLDHGAGTQFSSPSVQCFISQNRRRKLEKCIKEGKRTISMAWYKVLVSPSPLLPNPKSANGKFLLPSGPAIACGVTTLSESSVGVVIAAMPQGPVMLAPSHPWCLHGLTLSLIKHLLPPWWMSLDKGIHLAKLWFPHL